MLVEVLVYVGTVVFAVTGALTAVEKRFDVIGVLVLAAVTAIGGGSIRDLVVGIIPPTSLTNEPLLWAVFVSGLLVFALHRFIPTGATLYLLDTVALGMFAALGAERGIEAGFGFWGCVFAGAVSGVGGGIIRDVLSGEVPGVLYRAGDFYASAATVGAATTFLVHGISPTAALIAGPLVAIAMRLGSRLTGLNLPVPRTPG